ncbi:MAG: tRNA (adenosine(37)-N6)-threonylcarbamoyltransferase complex ATPase subunit type 1 TsaE [Spirochaetota bacterium]|nr:tRNA (adenosine(37)-N6)-threonylcarbamoyltransferase complex ATPase subunit type 1 TsaE [Spirochaetota bacterium]
MEEVFFSSSPEETENIGKMIAKKARPGDIFLFEGSLGAGKSVLIRGMAAELGITEPLLSPTFTLVNEYLGKVKFYHFDLYRLDEPFELYEIGFEEYVYSDGISCIEWASKCGELLPDESVKVDITLENEKRKITVVWKD